MAKITSEQVLEFKKAMATQEAVRGYPPADNAILAAVYAVLDDEAEADDTVSQKPLDEFHYHEAIHTASTLAAVVEHHLYDHGAVQAHPEIAKMVEEAIHKLGDAYQAIAKVRHTLYQ